MAEDTVVTRFVLEDFPGLTEEEQQALREDEWLRHKLADTFLEGLNWHEVAGFAVEAWRGVRDDA